MTTVPPFANLLVIRSPDIDRAVTFYQRMGLRFDRHSHGKGPEHCASDVGGFIFEIYPQKGADDITTNTRIGFNVFDVDGIVDRLREIHAIIVMEPTETEWGRRAVVKDFDGHTVELVTPQNRESTLAKYNRDDTSTPNAKDAK